MKRLSLFEEIENIHNFNMPEFQKKWLVKKRLEEIRYGLLKADIEPDVPIPYEVNYERD